MPATVIARERSVMVRLGKVIGWACAIVALGVLTAAWTRARPELTEQDAIDFTEAALFDAGFEMVAVDDLAVLGIQTNPEGDLPVWRTRAEVTGGVVELAIRRDLGQAVFVTDVTPEGQPLLRDGQFERLGNFETDPAVDRRIADNLRISAGAIALGIAATATATATPARGRRDHEEAEDEEGEDVVDATVVVPPKLADLPPLPEVVAPKAPSPADRGDAMQHPGDGPRSVASPRRQLVAPTRQRGRPRG